MTDYYIYQIPRSQLERFLKALSDSELDEYSFIRLTQPPFPCPYPYPKPHVKLAHAVIDICGAVNIDEYPFYAVVGTAANQNFEKWCANNLEKEPYFLTREHF